MRSVGTETNCLEKFIMSSSSHLNKRMCLCLDVNVHMCVYVSSETLGLAEFIKQLSNLL